MNIHKEVKEIAKRNTQIKRLVDKLAETIDVEGLEWSSAQFVSLTKEDIKCFDPVTSVTEDYLTDQRKGYCEDDYYGWLYFKTDVPGQYVRVYFSM